MAVTRVRGSNANSGATAGVTSLATTALAAAPPTTDVVFAFIGTVPSTGSTPVTFSPAGWNRVGLQIASPGLGYALDTFWRLGDGSTTSWTFSPSASCRISINIEQVTGADTTTPVDTSGNNTGAAVSSLSITTTGNVSLAGSYPMMAESRSQPAVTTTNTGWTREDAGGTGSAPNVQAQVWDTSAPTVGSTLTDAFSFSASANQVAALLLVIKPPVVVSTAAYRTLMGVGA